MYFHSQSLSFSSKVQITNYTVYAFVFQTADYYIYRADVFQDISWLTSLFCDSMRVFFKFYKVVRLQMKAVQLSWESGFRFSAPVSVNPPGAADAIAWRELHHPPTPHNASCGNNKGLWGFTISSET